MAKEFWFFGVVALMLFYSAIQMLIKNEGIKNEGNENNTGIKNEKLRIEFNIIDILLLAFYTWCFIRAIFTPYTPFYHNHKLQILTGMMVVYFFVKNAIRNERNVKNERNERNEKNKYSFISSFLHPFINKPFILSFLIFSFILSGLGQAIYGLLQLYGIYPSHHNLFKITGSFFNPAPYAMYLAVVFPVALGKTLFNERNEGKEKNESKKLGQKNSFILSFFNFFINHYSFISSFIHSFIQKYLPAVTVIAILLVLPATMNRASWLGALAGSLVVLQYKYNWLGKIKQWLNTRTKKLLAITGTILVVCGICISLFYLKAGSSNGRLFIWEVTLGKISEKPLFGHGLGRFEAEYNNWQAEYFQKHPEEMDGPKGWVAGNTKYAFNEYLGIASEAGIVGVTLFLGLIAALIINLMKKYSENNSLIIFISSLFSFFIIGLISFPFYSLPTCIIFFLLTGSLSAYSKHYRSDWQVIWLKGHTLAVACIVLAVITIIPLKKISYYRKWDDASFIYSIGNYTEANSEYQKCLPKLAYEGLLLQQYGKSLQMTGQNQKAIEMLEKAELLTSDQVLYTSLGYTFKELKQYSEAEKNYMSAFYMQPHKLYPQYLLAKLYAESGEKQKAIDKAKEVLNKNIKTKSLAVEEIKQEMTKLITKVSKP